MELIDDEGNLFSAVNVIDALVVLVVLGVAVAGAAVVLMDDPEPEPDRASTYATVDLGTQPAYIVEAINEGNTYSPDGDSQLTITDVHLTPQQHDIRVLLRVKLEGEATDGTVMFANAPPRLGRTVGIETPLYEVNGQIRAVGSADALERQPTTVILRDTMSAADAASVTPGDEIRLAQRTVATIDDVAIYATSDPDQRRVFVEATVDAHQQQGDLRFGDTLLRRGQIVTLPTQEYAIEGTIERVNEDLQLGSTSTRSVTLRIDGVRDDMAGAIQPGMTEHAGGETVARITDVDVQPSLIIATGEDGSVNVVDHPVNRDVTLTAEFQVRETATGVRFKGDSLRQGSTVVLDLGTVTIEATVVNVGS